MSAYISASPHIGNWYKSHHLHDIFEVIASDDQEETIEIQYINGEIEEVDLETWHYQLQAIGIAEPYDWLEPHELDSTECTTNLNSPLVYIEPEQEEFDWHQKYTR